MTSNFPRKLLERKVSSCNPFCIMGFIMQNIYINDWEFFCIRGLSCLLHLFIQPLVSEWTHTYLFYTLRCNPILSYLFFAQIVPALATETSSSWSLRPFPLTEPQRCSGLPACLSVSLLRGTLPGYRPIARSCPA